MRWKHLIPWLRRLPRVQSPGPYTVEHDHAFEEPCPCCGDMEKTTVGWVCGPPGIAVAMYSVRWKPGLPEDHGGTWRLVIGDWRNNRNARRRALVGLVFSKYAGQWQYSVLDSELEGARLEGVAGIALHRDEIIGTPFAKHVFDMVDAILLNEPSLDEIRHHVYHV